ncbi:hypothetical protein MRB53_014306 [Persea americana]|uniref:Uncharacterized protein n=1 Tax=Persea americana TaxID=3435 RepID=A0ACC2KAI0_PERAE|nr:hypothetical protein MRB53_014306 [Persea americana]
MAEQMIFISIWKSFDRCFLFEGFFYQKGQNLANNFGETEMAKQISYFVRVCRLQREEGIESRSVWSLGFKQFWL